MSADHIAQIIRSATPYPEIKTPLLYMDAMLLAERALSVPSTNPIVTFDQVAKTLLAVDVASREQSGKAELLAALKKVLAALDNDCPLTAQQEAYAAIVAVEPEFEPMETVAARIESSCSDDYADDPARDWKAGA